MISMFMMGGPSQIDLFDPKPELIKRNGQQFEGDIQFDNAAQASRQIMGPQWAFRPRGRCGMEVSDLLPHLLQADHDEFFNFQSTPSICVVWWFVFAPSPAAIIRLRFGSAGGRVAFAARWSYGLRWSRRCSEIDRPAAALVGDLKRRGMLDSTLVHWGGEMGRLPTIQVPVGSTGTDVVGRDHNTHGFSMWVAGGGLKQGYAHGKTDEFSHHAVEGVVTNHDWLATVLHLFGLSHEELKFRVGSRTLVLVENRAAKVVKEILA